MATPTITETLELPGGTLTTAAARAIKVRLRLVAADSGEAVGYATGDDVTVGGTRWTTPNTSGVYSFSTVRPNSGSSGDQISSPSGTVYELVVRFLDRPPVTRYIDVPDTAGPHLVQDILTDAPSDMLSPLLDGTTGVAVSFDTDGDIGVDTLTDWTDASVASTAFDSLSILSGRVVVPDPDTGAINGTNPAAHGVAWRDWSHLGSWTGSRVAVGGWWTGERPMEATPLIHVVTSGSDEYGIGVWPGADLYPLVSGYQSVLLFGYVGNNNTNFEVTATRLFSALPENIDLEDGRRHHFELRSWDGYWSFWIDGVIITPQVNNVDVDPWMAIPSSLLGSTKHGFALDNNQLDGNAGAGGARTPNVGAFEGPWTIAPLVDRERAPATAAGVAGALAYKADSTDLDNHMADTVAAHAASAISYAGGTGISATTVEGAIDELATEKANLAGAAFTGNVSVAGELTAIGSGGGSLKLDTETDSDAAQLAAYGSGDTHPRLAVGYSVFDVPTISMGPGGSTAPDTTLYRSAAGVVNANGGGFAGIGKGLVLTEQTAPSSPAANDITLYAADNGSGTTVLRTKDSAGTVTTLGSGGGGLTAEDVRDTIGTALVEGEAIDITVNDGADTISIAAEDASDTNKGVVELATTAETTTGTDTARAVTPDGLAGSEYGVEVVQILVTDPSGSAITTGDGKAYFMVPTKLNGWNLIRANAAVTTVSSSGTPTVQVHNVTDAVDMLSTRITIDANESTSYTAATPPVIDTTKDDVATGDLIRVDVDVAGTGAKGLIVMLSFQAP